MTKYKMASPVDETLTIILAGGQGERLYPLTRDRAKPAVPFGGIYRVIDFTLSNCLNSQLRKIEVLTQYKSLSLARHLKLGWNLFNYKIGEYINNTPPQQRLRKTWYQGTADAVYQNIYTLERARPKYVIILSGDHIYKMDYRKMLAFHKKNKADVTIGSYVVPRSEASEFGIIEKNREDRVVGFQEKPQNPKGIPGDPNHSLVSMGIYIFDAEKLVKRVIEDAKLDNSHHDFGKDVIPTMLKKKDNVFVYRLDAGGAKYAYWRDIGTLDAFYEAHMDLIGKNASFDLFSDKWPLHSHTSLYTPPIIHNTSTIHDSIIANGCSINSATVSGSILSPGVKVEKGAVVRDSIIMDHVKIGAGAIVEKTIIDKGVQIPKKMHLSAMNSITSHGFTRTKGGVLVIPKEEPL